MVVFKGTFSGDKTAGMKYSDNSVQRTVHGSAVGEIMVAVELNLGGSPAL